MYETCMADRQCKTAYWNTFRKFLMRMIFYTKWTASLDVCADVRNGSHSMWWMRKIVNGTILTPPVLFRCFADLLHSGLHLVQSFSFQFRNFVFNESLSVLFVCQKGSLPDFNFDHKAVNIMRILLLIWHWFLLSFLVSAHLKKILIKQTQSDFIFHIRSLSIR